MKTAANHTNQQSRSEYEAQMDALGIDGKFLELDASEVVNPVHFYLFDPLLTGTCSLACVEMADLQRMGTHVLPALRIPEDEFHHKAQTFAIDFLLFGAPTQEIANQVIYRNILSYLMRPHGQQLLESPPLASGTYHAGSLFYVNKLEGDLVDATSRPISGHSESPMTADQLAQYCLPYMADDVEAHPDYWDRYPIKAYLTSGSKAKR